MKTKKDVQPKSDCFHSIIASVSFEESSANFLEQSIYDFTQAGHSASDLSRLKSCSRFFIPVF